MASIQTDHGLVETDDPFAVHLAPQADFFETSGLQQLQYRALTYLTAGVPVHFRGPAGTGKTTLAMQIAASIGRPTAIISGDSWMTSSDLLGESKGVRTRQVVDRYVHSVRRTETESEEVWSDNILTRAIINGYTLIYDEFTRSTPEANNPLLMAFEERMLIIPDTASGHRYVSAHPEFRAILTSNPADYAGVSKPQDALIDRMITLDVSYHDRDAEIGIVITKTGLAKSDAAKVVDVVRAVREAPAVGQSPSLRASLMIAQIVKSAELSVSAKDPAFVQLCFDILQSKAPQVRDAGAQAAFQDALVAAIKVGCAKTGRTAAVPEWKEAS